MRHRVTLLIVVALFVSGAGVRAKATTSDVERGAQAFAACMACHTLVPNRNMTGPSLAGVWGRRAGRLESFDRYSPALKISKVVWNARTLDAWLASPAHLIPNNYMTFPGIADTRRRANLVAFLQQVGAGHGSGSMLTQGSGMMGMAPQLQDLRTTGRERQVRAIRLCRDSYFVTTANGKTRPFWEPNLRFETDSSALGPPQDIPVIMPAGMFGDRAAVIFAKPSEISAFVRHQC